MPLFQAKPKTAPPLSASNEAAWSALAVLTPEAALAQLGGDRRGLDQAQVAQRLDQYGPNRISSQTPPSVWQALWSRLVNPLNGLLLSLAALSWWLRDLRSALVIATMVVLSMVLGLLQEHRSNLAAAKLASLIRTRASVLRRDGQDHPLTPGALAGQSYFEVPLDQLVPGDLVHLSAGDMVPADLRLLTTKDLNINQSALTGESMPVGKAATGPIAKDSDATDLPNICFMGSNVVSGFATAVVVHTGAQTRFGKLAKAMTGREEVSSFDIGIGRFSWLMIRFILVMAPLVFVINGATKGDWGQALIFAMAVAVGLTPELLPMIVTVNLAQGAMAMARRKVIVKRLNAIQNFGAMDILCTDKTGTLTQDKVVLKQHLDVMGQEDQTVLDLAYLNSYFQSGLQNLLDQAVLVHAELEQGLIVQGGYTKLDEAPFDFTRRRMSVVVAKPNDPPVLICKGAVEEVFAQCTHYRQGQTASPLDTRARNSVQAVADGLNQDGFRVVAVAVRYFDVPKDRYSAADETDLELVGFIAFLDPPKETAAKAIADLGKAGVAVKILTGDNGLVTAKICAEVGIDHGRIVLGHEIEAMSDQDLARLVLTTQVFAKTSPEQKARIIRALRQGDHVVGFMGDGINDGPALKAADVGISVDTAVDIAKESADIILLEKSLAVLVEGVAEGRRVFGNITKYIKMGASSNFGNMFSVLGASLALPFLPMLPIQILTNNLLYDVSQTAIPTDTVDADYLAAPRRWEINNLMRFMLFIGPISSIFDYATFGVMWWVFKAGQNPALFQTGWFVESLLTQTLIIHVIRTNKIPFFQSRASTALILTSLGVAMIGMALPYTRLGTALGMVPLPGLYWPILASFLMAYATLTHLVKTWFIRKWGY